MLTSFEKGVMREMFTNSTYIYQNISLIKLFFFLDYYIFQSKYAHISIVLYSYVHFKI